MKRAAYLSLFLTVLITAVTAHAGSFSVYGPQDYVRGTGDPVTVTRSFAVENPTATQYTLRILNGGLADGEAEKVSSTVIAINGVDVVGPEEFNQNVRLVEKEVQLQAANEISVQLRGKPGGVLRIEISGIDNDPPTIRAAPSPAPQNGWNNTEVTVTFQCADAISGIASCTEPVLVSTEGGGQVVTGTATDKAGNTATFTVTLSIDTTAPSVTIVSPSAGAVVSNSALQVTGSVLDNLSGVSSVQCNGTSGSSLASNFNCEVLLTEGSNQVVVEAEDVAGNSGMASVTVFLNSGGDLDPPPDFLLVTPGVATMAVGESRQLQLVDNFGRTIPATGWQVSDGSVVEITSGSTPTLNALAAGQVTITGHWRELSAQAQVTILEGSELPRGTVRWAVTPLPGSEIGNIVQALPTGRGTPDLYSVERTFAGENVVRAFTSDGRQQWLSFVGSSPLQSQAPLAASALAAATTVSETIRGVAPSNAGGLLLSVFRVTFGDRILIENGLAMVDPETRGERWRYMTSNTLNARWALHPDGTIFVVESERSGANRRLLAFDGATGLVKYSLPLPLSSQLTIAAGCVGEVQQTTFSPSQFGSPMVAPDGLVHLPVEVLERVNVSRVCDGVSSGSSDYRINLRLMQVSPDGSAAFSSLHFEEFLGTAPSPLVAPRAFPGELVPDGEGGILAAFGYARAEPTVVNEARVAHWTANGVSEYALPFVGVSGFGGARGLGTTEALVVGENGTAYATNLNKVVAFDMASGAIRWSWVPSDGFIEHVAAAAEGGLVMRNEVDFTNRIVRLDASGQVSYDDWTLQTGLGFDRFLDSITPSWSDAWLAVEFNSAFPNGALASLSATEVLWAASQWTVPSTGNTRAAEPRITVPTSVSVVFRSTDGVDAVEAVKIRSQVENSTKFWWQRAKINLVWDGTIARVPSCDPVRYPNGCADPLTDILEITHPTTLSEFRRRFCVPSIPLVRCTPRGSQVVFLLTITPFGGLPGTLLGFVPTTPGTDNPINIAGISASAEGIDLAHELGHQFQLRHVEVPAWVLLLPPPVQVAVAVRTNQNLMCAGFVCSTHANDRLTPEQVEKARQEAKALE